MPKPWSPEKLLQSNSLEDVLKFAAQRLDLQQYIQVDDDSPVSSGSYERTIVVGENISGVISREA